MKPLRYHPATNREARDAVSWYLTQSGPAAADFTDELESVLARVQTNPKAFTPYLLGTRRALLHRFPYSIVYRERLHDIQIIALAHAKRRPGYWAKRLKQ